MRARTEEQRLADLHCHSTVSDGQLEPWQVVELAARQGLHVVALTDHDTVAGVEPARQRARALGLEVVPALELSTAWGAQEIHLLGYFVDVAAPPLLRELQRQQEARWQRARLMARRLAALGYPISWARVRELGGQGTVGRVHLARALVEAGHVASMGQAFDQFLAEGRPAYVPQARLTVQEGIGLIAAAGGVPVLAHPGLAQVDHLIPAWKAQGLAGLEVVHPAHDSQQEAHYLRLAQEWDLLPTGGSDAHGRERPEDQPGAVRVPLAWVEGLRRVATRPSRRP